MKNLLAIASAALVLGYAAFAHSGEALTAKQIMENNFYAGKIKSFKAVSEIVLITSAGEKRERKLSNIQVLQADGINSKFVAKFIDPADVRGTGFLQVEHSDADNDQWIYLPALQKSRRLVANNKKDSFFGSDFSYGDITLPKVADYTHQLTGTEAVDGFDCYVIESVPANETVKDNNGCSKKISWIRKDNFVETKVDYYDLGGQLLKTQLTGKDKKLESNPDRWFPLHREMNNVQTGHKTTIDFTKVTSGVTVDDSVFSTRYLER